MKYNKKTLKQLKELLEDLGYKVRYERGHFESGHCIVADQRVIVINKFFDTEGRVHTLLEILWKLPLDESQLSERSKRFFGKLPAKLRDHNKKHFKQEAE